MHRVSVLIPTHEHSETLEPAVASVLRQTYGDLDVMILGDGPTDAVRAIAAKLSASDPRVRYIEREKGAGDGREHRDELVRSSDADMMLYLADDDLWLQDHVERMVDWLAECDMVASAAGIVGTRPESREHMRVDDRLYGEHPWNGIRMSSAGHWVDAYRRLPTGWVDLDYKSFWSQFWAEGLRAVVTNRVTALHFPNSRRGDMSPSDRGAELWRWLEMSGGSADGIRGDIHHALSAVRQSRAPQPSVRNLGIEGVELLELAGMSDHRGGLVELWRKKWNRRASPAQWNLVHSGPRVMRGMHWHELHFDVIAVMAGEAVLGLADIRSGSPTAGATLVVGLKHDEPAAVCVPPGVAHGIYTPRSSTLMYGVSRPYDPNDEFALRYDDPDLAIDWPFESEPVLSDRDRDSLPLRAVRRLPPYEETQRTLEPRSAKT